MCLISLHFPVFYAIHWLSFWVKFFDDSTGHELAENWLYFLISLTRFIRVDYYFDGHYADTSSCLKLLFTDNYFAWIWKGRSSSVCRLKSHILISAVSLF